MIVALYDHYVALPKTIEERKEELKGFIENYIFPFIGAWDGFHVDVATPLKNHYSFKHKYTISNMGLVGYSKRFLNVTCSAPDGTHDARLLLLTNVFSEIQFGRAIPLQYLDLGEGLGEISLVTIGYTAFFLIYLAVERFPREKRSKEALFLM